MADTTYDTTEATALMKRLVGDRDHNARHVAVMTLKDALLRIIEESGGNFAAEEEPGAKPLEVFISRGNSPVCRFFFDASGVQFRDAGPNPAPARRLAIEYRADEGRFVGTKEDQTTHPVPGAPRQRRSAVAVLVEELATTYRAQHSGP